jgi:hypothetical protein
MAILPMRCYPQEDAVVVKKSFVERGGLLASTSITYVSEASTPNSSFTERFEKPTIALSKKVGSYDHINGSGLPEINTTVHPADIIIGKTQTITRTPAVNVGTVPTKQIQIRRDISTSIRQGHGGQVTLSAKSTLPTGTKAVVRVETIRHFGLCDKISTDAAMKGGSANKKEYICTDIKKKQKMVFLFVSNRTNKTKMVHSYSSHRRLLRPVVHKKSPMCGVYFWGEKKTIMTSMVKFKRSHPRRSGFLFPNIGNFFYMHRYHKKKENGFFICEQQERKTAMVHSCSSHRRLSPPLVHKKSPTC